MRIYRKIYFLIILFSTFYFNAFGQDENKEAAQQIVEIANEAYFNLRVILLANEQYVQAAEMDPDNIEANYMAGRTSLQTNSKASASKYLLRVYALEPNYKFNVLYMIGQGYHYGLEFEKAIDYYNQYLDKLNQSGKSSGEDFTPKEQVERRIYECHNGLEFVNAPGDYTIENAGPAINSEWDDFAPVVTADESFMAFTTRRQDGNSNVNVFDDMLFYEDVFYSNRSGDNWMPANNIGPPVNIIYHSSNLAISADGTQLYLFKSQNGGDIFLSEKLDDGTWSEPVPLNENVNSSYFENAASISPDGNTLYFSSDRPIVQGKTDLDIYYSVKDRKGNWGPAKNLGPTINTPFDDDGPFIDYDGKTLYFSSKGHKGMGGYDIFQTVYNDQTEEWSEPKNLGYPLNSPDNDVYFVSTRDGKRGYYASAKADGMGFTDIYHIRLADLDAPPKKVEAKKIEAPEPVKPEVIESISEVSQPVILILKAVDNQTKENLDVDFSIKMANGRQSVPVRRIGSGLYQAQFMNETKIQYNVSVQKSGYMYKNVIISIPPASTKINKLAKQIALNKIKVGYSQVIRNVYFDFGTARLKTTSNPELDKLLKVLQDNPKYIIEISGHTDNVGGKDFNQWLSKRRAQAIVDYMVKKGQNSARFLAEGYGEERPLASNDDEELGREFNRRVEFKVLKFKQ